MSTVTADDAPLIIPVAPTSVSVGRSDDATVRLLHASISRRHATLRLSANGLVVEDLDSRFGTYLNGTRIRTATARPGDRIQFGSVIVYRVEPGRLQRELINGGMEIVATGLSVSVARPPSLRDVIDRTLRSGLGRDRTTILSHERRSLIRDVEFHVRPDAFVGVLGPSGAGKSTVMHCLAGYLPPGRGCLCFDGRRNAYGELDAYRAMIGHIPQDDVVYRTLTARENLQYAARLRLGKETSTETIEATVGQVLEHVGLTEHADKRAGILSGGQRKRLSVAVELLRRPRLLLLDEPTSGLDPASEAHLMEQLRLLARQGTTIVCATHLMENVHLFDEVIVLGLISDEESETDGLVQATSGRVAYRGPPDGLLQHFGRRHHADLYECLASGRFVPSSGIRDEHIAADSPVPEAKTPPVIMPMVERREVKRDTALSRPDIARAAAIWVASAPWHQSLVIARRAGQLLVRDRGLMLAMLAQALTLGVLVGLTQYHVLTIFPILFFAVAVAIWLGLNNSARDLVRERRHYVRDRLAGLRPQAYLAAKAAVQVAAGAIQLMIFVVVLRIVSSLAITDPNALKSLQAASMTWLYFILLASYVGGLGLGLLVSALARTEEAAVAALPLLILPQLLISAVATQTSNDGYEQTRPFRPLVVATRGLEDRSAPELVVDLLSLACLSRPAAISAERPIVDGYGRWGWVADLCHLVILLLVIWLLVLLAFGWAEQRWLRLLGLV